MFAIILLLHYSVLLTVGLRLHYAIIKQLFVVLCVCSHFVLVIRPSFSIRLRLHPFNGLFSGITRVSQYRKVESSLD